MLSTDAQTSRTTKRSGHGTSAGNTRRAGRFAAMAHTAMCGAIVAAMLACIGCESPVIGPPAEPVVSTMVIDKAMQDRDFSPTPVYFVNTTVQTGNDGVTLVLKHGEPCYVYYFMDTPTFLTNLAAMPGSAVLTPPTEDVPNRGATFPPSHTDARPSTPF